MNQHDQAKKQFELVIKADLNRWFMESDLDAQDLAGVVIKAIDEWAHRNNVRLHFIEPGKPIQNALF